MWHLTCSIKEFSWIPLFWSVLCFLWRFRVEWMSSGWITSPLLSKFGGSYPQGFQTCPFSVGVCSLSRETRFWGAENSPSSAALCYNERCIAQGSRARTWGSRICWQSWLMSSQMVLPKICVDGTDQSVQSLMFMVMMMMTIILKLHTTIWVRLFRKLIWIVSVIRPKLKSIHSSTKKIVPC